MFPARELAFAGAIVVCTLHAQAQQTGERQLEPVVVSASRSEQSSFDAPAAIDSVTVDAFRTASPLVNLSELLSAVPGVQVRERQNYAQDLQLSVRGFGTRSTFGVRGVRIIIDGIPATMPDGQGQAATASLTSARRIEVLRGPVAQLYGNAAGGVVQVFTRDPPISATPVTSVSAGAGSYRQRQFGASIGGGSDALSALVDVSHFSTDGYRDHSAAERTQLNAKALAKLSDDTSVTGILNIFDLPVAQDPLGLNRADFENNPRQVVPAALSFDTRKSVRQHQAGFVFDHRFSAADSISARVYAGNRKVNQTLAFSGAAPTSSGGVVDLDSDYYGGAASWTSKAKVNHMPLQTTIGIEAGQQDQWRRGFVNNAGSSGDLRRDEDSRVRNIDVFGQVDWSFTPAWQAIAGVRASKVRFSIADHYLTAASPDDSGKVDYSHTSPVLGLVWHASDAVNIYGNIGQGFETPTQSELAYRPDGSGPNLALQPSISTQAEVGMKIRSGIHALDTALFIARSRDEITPLTTLNGRAIYQNVDEVERRGAEVSWKAGWGKLSTQLGYTLLDATFRKSFSNGTEMVAAGNRLPGAPMHSLFTELAYKVSDDLSMAVEMRAESKAYVDDVNSDAAPGYAVFNARAGLETRAGAVTIYWFARLDNMFDKHYAGSVIVNDGNRRFFEPAAGRRLFVGARTQF
ncbi:MAG: TonB-dependent receptor [Pseudomonadota bacterium]